MLDQPTFTCRRCTLAFRPTESQRRKHQYVCMGCRVADQRAYRAKLSDDQKARIKEMRKPRRLVARRLANQKGTRENRILLAQRHLMRAVEQGWLVPKPCNVCGAENTHGHHPDYRHTLDVVWLCPLHHAAEHKRLRDLGIEIPA